MRSLSSIKSKKPNQNMSKKQKPSKPVPPPPRGNTPQREANENPPEEYSITIRILGGLNTRQQNAFEAAADFWSHIITADVPAVRVDGEVIDDLLIEAIGTRIDGPSGILGQAGPTHLREGSSIPVKGHMEFDRDDLGQMESDGTLESVIIHEMGHVIGIGTLWAEKGLIRDSGTANPVFVGPNAMAEFGALLGTGEATPVPIENEGGPGTREGHWRERVFGNELMTGFINRGSNPLSRLTAASIEDLGYVVNRNAAQPFAIPRHLELAMMGLFADDHPQRCCSCGRRHASPMIVPASQFTTNRRQPRARAREFFVAAAAAPAASSTRTVVYECVGANPGTDNDAALLTSFTDDLNGIGRCLNRKLALTRPYESGDIKSTWTIARLLSNVANRM